MTVKQAVISTLAYFDLFGIPLTRDEISEYLFFSEPDNKKIDIYLRESPLVHAFDGYYSLKRDLHFYEVFKFKLKKSKSYWKRVRQFQWLFSLCPYIKLVAVCNSLPIRDIQLNSDIDLFVITDKNKLFTARFFLTLFTSIFFVRRHGRKVRKRFCLSFYTTEDNLNLKEIVREPYDIYLAYWLKTLEPVSGSYFTYEEFLKENKKWSEPYFHKISSRKRRYRKAEPWQTKWKHRLEKYFAAEKWENFFKRWQLKRAYEKAQYLSDKSGTIISDKMLKFHDKDIRDQLRQDWVKTMNELL